MARRPSLEAFYQVGHGYSTPLRLTIFSPHLFPAALWEEEKEEEEEEENSGRR